LWQELEVGLWLTSSIVVGWDFFLMGVWQGLSLGGEEKSSMLLHFTFQHRCHLLMWVLAASQTHRYYSWLWMQHLV
jgi:hypothetical protein